VSQDRQPTRASQRIAKRKAERSARLAARKRGGIRWMWVAGAVIAAALAAGAFAAFGTAPAAPGWIVGPISPTLMG
jgi:hypothetical protein